MCYLQQQRNKRKSARKQKTSKSKQIKLQRKNSIKNIDLLEFFPQKVTNEKVETIKQFKTTMNRDETISAICRYIHHTIMKNEFSSSRPRRMNSSPFFTLQAPSSPSLFDALTPVDGPPSVSTIQELFTSIMNKRRLTLESGIVSLVLLERTKIKITSRNWDRLVLVSLLLANKEAEDVYSVYNVRFEGFIPGLQVYEINFLELEYLQMLKYRLHVEQQEYLDYYAELLNFVPEDLCVEGESQEVDFEGESSVGDDSLPDVEDLEGLEDDLEEVDVTNDEELQNQEEELVEEEVEDDNEVEIEEEEQEEEEQDEEEEQEEEEQEEEQEEEEEGQEEGQEEEVEQDEEVEQNEEEDEEVEEQDEEVEEEEGDLENDDMVEDQEDMEDTNQVTEDWEDQ